MSSRSHLPALRERNGDVALLLEHFLNVFCTANEVPLKRIDSDAMDVLESNPWPGNVRELENTVQRLVLMSEGETITVSDLPRPLFNAVRPDRRNSSSPTVASISTRRSSRSKSPISRPHLTAPGGKTAAAALLRIPVQKMKYLCRKYGL